MSLMGKSTVSPNYCFKHHLFQVLLVSVKGEATSVEYAQLYKEADLAVLLHHTDQVTPLLEISKGSHSAKTPTPHQERSVDLPASASSVSTSSPPSPHPSHSGHLFLHPPLPGLEALLFSLVGKTLRPSNSWLMWASSPMSPLQGNLC